MDILKFKEQIVILRSKYGSDKVSNEYCNALWLAYRDNYTDDEFKSKVSFIMCSKPVHGERFTIEDFAKLKPEEERTDRPFGNKSVIQALEDEMKRLKENK